MEIRPPHEWDLAPRQAIGIQQTMRARVRVEDELPTLEHVAGVDVGFEDGGRTTRAAVVVLSWPDLEAVESAIARCATAFPYVPGLLSFRELPAILDALQAIHTEPQLVFCDGQGIAHPRRFGIACHLGVIADLAAIGVGKSRLVGAAQSPGPDKGDRTPLLDGEEVIGCVLRTRSRVRPVYVSPGHRVSLDTAVELTLAATPRYRLPEPIRAADRLASNRAPDPGPRAQGQGAR